MLSLRLPPPWVSPVGFGDIISLVDCLFRWTVRQLFAVAVAVFSPLPNVVFILSNVGYSFLTVGTTYLQC
jgi:hypothetical protein